MTRRIAKVTGLMLLLGAAVASPEDVVRRFALVAGSNHGSPDRVPLRYAISDAERFAAVVTQMGGVQLTDRVLLREPSRQAFLDALANVRARAVEAQQGAARTEVLLYYSGHADDKGLLLGRELFAYRELRDALNGIPADVSIAVLDACASGAITRLKGGVTHPAFLTDASVQLRGHAFLTSSSENEAAQESDALRGSFFTHALLSGLRGAADVSGDGKVTLGEAYQFAFNETLAQTTTSQGGAQHPAYDIKMAGTGDVVITDVRQMSSSLVFDPELDGRFFVRNSKRQLVAELYKPYGRSVELGLEPGSYEIFYEQERVLLTSNLTVEQGQRITLGRTGLKPTKRSFTRPRGGEASLVNRWALSGRSRFEMTFGLFGSASAVEVGENEVTVNGASFALVGAHWLREYLALDVRLLATGSEVKTQKLPEGDRTRTVGSVGLLFGVRGYGPKITYDSPLRPYLYGAIGPFTDVVVDDNATEKVTSGNGRVFGYLGGGVDVQIGRYLMLNVHGGWILDRDSHPRFDAGFGLGCSFGSGTVRD